MNMSAVHLNGLADQCHETSKAHGFWDDRDDPSDITCYLANEAYRLLYLTEVVEGIRRGDPTFFAGSQRLTDLREKLTPQQIGQLSRLVMGISEKIEAIEAVLDDQDNYPRELADDIIRTLDLAKGDNIDIGHVVVEVMAQNVSRPRLHGKLA